MNQAPVDITPKNGGHLPWAGKNPDQFEKDWSFKPVSLNGHFDFDNEIYIAKTQLGEKGYDVLTPFYTHVNDKNELCGVTVNRGWVPSDLKGMRKDRNVSKIKVDGILYRGDAQTKYSK